MRQAVGNLRQLSRFLTLPARWRRLVVYSEGPAYWPHLGPVVQALLARQDVELSYVSSSPDDPGVALRHPRLNSHVIGDGHARTLFFSTLDAELLLMTMPDLNTFHIKRSCSLRHCVYLHHSLVSCHMAYREHAFDHFDTILCAGPHHAAEIRAIEAAYQLPPKQLVAHGLARLDSIMAAATDDLRGPGRPLVLVAPSWGPDGLLERHADALMQALAHTDWDVIVRPHPQTVRLAPEALRIVRAWVQRADNLQLETSVVGHDSLRRASVMISDWSGAAFDFALGLARPVLFIDVPRKVNNPNYQRVAVEPIEVFARAQMGSVLAVDQLHTLPQCLSDMLRNPAFSLPALSELVQRWVFNAGSSAEVAADWLTHVLAARD